MRNVAAMVVAFGLAACAGSAQATEPFAKVRTYAMTWLNFPRGVRSIGMGATGTADASGVGTGYFNPAGMAFTDATRLAGSYEDIGAADITLSEVVLSAPIPFRSDSPASAWRFAGALSYGRLGMDPQTERTIFLPEGTGNTFDASDWALSALGAASWTQGVASIAAGVNGKYLRSNLATSAATAWALDVGVLAAFPLDVGGGVLRPRLGYALLNLDTGVSYDNRESTIANQYRAAFGFDVSTPRITAWGRAVHLAALSIDYDRVDYEQYSDVEYAAGFEVSIIEFMHFRYGTINSDVSTYGFGLGWDYGQVLFRVDYAHAEDPESFLDLDRDTVGALIGVRW